MDIERLPTGLRRNVSAVTGGLGEGKALDAGARYPPCPHECTNPLLSAAMTFGNPRLVATNSRTRPSGVSRNSPGSGHSSQCGSNPVPHCGVSSQREICLRALVDVRTGQA